MKIGVELSPEMREYIGQSDAAIRGLGYVRPAESDRMSRRERIATAALQGMLARAESVAPNEWSYILVAHAIEYADTMIAALDKDDGR